MTSCAFCGRDNQPDSRFCIDCGKPLNSSAARVGPAYVPSTSGGQPKPVKAATPAVVAEPPRPLPLSPNPSASVVPSTRVSSSPVSARPCPRCSQPVDAALPFCGHCGARATAEAATGTCGSCGASYTEGVDVFCARCGNRVGQRVSVDVSAAGGTMVLGAAARAALGPRLAALDESGEVAATYSLERGEAVIGRGEADIQFPDDHYMSPLHARVELREGQLLLRDLGSRNGSWVFLEEPTRLTDGDLVLVGSQLLRFRRLGYPGPHPPEADSTRRMGSLTPSADVAIVEQLRADGSVRDTLHLSPGRTVLIGRETGDWLFPYDQTMSGRHAEIRSEDNEFWIHDAGSRNGVAMAVRGERVLRRHARILLGDQILRVESL